mgnify:CR=1 FL=1
MLKLVCYHLIVALSVVVCINLHGVSALLLLANAGCSGVSFTFLLTLRLLRIAVLFLVFRTLGRLLALSQQHAVRASPMGVAGDLYLAVCLVCDELD